MTTDSLTTTDHAANLRKAYKALGWSSRKISVRSEYFSMGSAINVTIKDASVDFAKVKKMAEEHQHIRRDGFGEILSGCNTYVSVNLSRDVKDTLIARHLEACETAIAALADLSSNELVIVAGTKAMIGKDGVGWFRLWYDDREGMNVSDARSAALWVAQYENGWR